LTNLTGMDPQAVLSIATGLDSQSGHIQNTIVTVDGIVQNMMQNWHGSDAQTFLGWWQNQHRPALVAAGQSISGLAQSARNNVSQQETTSAPTAAGVGPTVGVAPATVGVAAAAGGVAAAAGGAAASSAAAPGSTLTAEQSSAIGWAQKQLTAPSVDYAGPNGDCYQFVGQAYDTGLKAEPTAWDAYNYYKGQGDIQTTTPPPAGAVVFYNYVDPSNGVQYGHAALSLGSGQVICTQDSSHSDAGVVEVNYANANGALPLSTGAASECTYVGWYLPTS